MSAPSSPAHVPADARLRRLLAILAWLGREGQGRIADIARRFDMSEEEVGAELES